MPIAPTPPDDLALMAQIAQADPHALKALYDRYAGLVYTLALRMLKDRSDAEQLLTDVFFELWQSRARYDPARANPKTYLTTLTRSRAIDKLRRKGPVGTQLNTARLDPANGIDVPTLNPGLAAIDAADDRAKITKALASLDREQRAAIEAAYFDGLSHSQIADRLQKPLGTVKSCIRLGLARLRDLLQPAAAPEIP